MRGKAHNCLLSIALATCLSMPAVAGIDVALNTTSFVSGQPSVISADGIVTAGGTSTSITGALLVIQFDASKLTVSGLTAGPNGWGIAASNTEQASEGRVLVILTNSSGNTGQGQTSDGPILYFTVTPAGGGVDINDCATIRLYGTDSQLSDQGYETITPSDPCAGPLVPVVTPPDTPEDIGGVPMGPLNAGISAGKGDVNGDGLVNTQDAVMAVRIAAGKDTGTPDQMARADVAPAGVQTIGDGDVTLADAMLVLRIAGGLDVQPDAPSTAHDLRVAATGADESGNLKLTIYWVGLAGADSYQIFRGTTPGGEDYNSPIATIQENAAAHSYPGSPYLWYTDVVAPESEGTWYYYTIRAATAVGITAPSEEAGVVATASGVLWDTRDPVQVLPTFLRQFRLGGTPTGQVRIVGPDETVYDSSSTDPLPPEGSYEPATNTYTLAGGDSFALPSDPPTAGDIGIESIELPPSDGPYRSVRSNHGFYGSYMGVTLPGSNNMDIRADLGDVAFVYVGANGKTEIDIGLQYSPAFQDWGLYALWRRGAMKIARPLFVRHPSRIPAIAGITTSYRYYAVPIPYAGGLLTVTHLEFGNPVPYTVGTYADTESAIRMKRVASIAQKGMAKMVRLSGSRLGINSGVYFTGCSLLDWSGNATPWDLSQNYQDGIFTGGGNAIITFGGTLQNETNLRIWAIQGG
jgi:hypothetical protein